MKEMNSYVKLLKNVGDLDNLENSTIKYLNIDIMNPNIDIIEKLSKLEGEYYISDYMDSKYGYVYTSIEKFKEGQNIINGIIGNLNMELSSIDLAKEIYIKLCKLVRFDINVMEDKNDIYNFSMANRINNMWESISNGYVNNVSLCKIYMFICSLCKIKCSIISDSIGYLSNKLEIDNKYYIVDICRDVAYVIAGYKTRYFDNYNDDKEMDKRIGYVINKYNDDVIEDIMKHIDYSDKDFLECILNRTCRVLDMDNIGSMELSIIYQDIFDKYTKNYNIMVNNLYVNKDNNRNHFILISYNNKHYSYNYSLSKFIRIEDRDIANNINNNNIGIYMDEDIRFDNYDVIEEIS